MELMREKWTDERLDDLNGKVDDLGRKVDLRFDGVDRRFEAMERRFEGIDRRLDKMLLGLCTTFIVGFLTLGSLIVERT